MFQEKALKENNSKFKISEKSITTLSHEQVRKKARCRGKIRAPEYLASLDYSFPPLYISFSLLHLALSPSAQLSSPPERARPYHYRAAVRRQPLCATRHDHFHYYRRISLARVRAFTCFSFHRRATTAFRDS